MFLFLFCGTGYDGILRAERVSERELYIERDTEREREGAREREPLWAPVSRSEKPLAFFYSHPPMKIFPYYRDTIFFRVQPKYCDTFPHILTTVSV